MRQQQKQFFKKIVLDKDRLTHEIYDYHVRSR